MTLSFVIPLKDEAESLPLLYEQILAGCAVASVSDFELLFIDDGSSDNSFPIINELSKKDAKVKCIRFRKNYGKSAALAVGFEHVVGEFVITMDADLQDDPAEIPHLLDKIKSEQLDLVSGWKKVRHDPFSKTFPSKVFNWVTGKLVGLRLHDFNCGLKIYRHDVVKEVEIYGELHRYVPALAHLLGFKVGELAVLHHPRKFGHSKFGMNRFFTGFLDLATVLFINKYMKRPLHFFGGWGILFFLVGFAICLWLAIGWFQGNIIVSNRPILFLGILLIILGIQFMSTGFLGEMLTKIYHRSFSYSIKEKLNLE